MSGGVPINWRRRVNRNPRKVKISVQDKPRQERSNPWKTRCETQHALKRTEHKIRIALWLAHHVSTEHAGSDVF